VRVLLDESVPRALGFELEGHFVRTAQSVGFSTLSNGKLMQAMVEMGFEVLVTFDQNLPYQQNANLPVAIIILVAQDNRVETAKGFASGILKTLTTLQPGQLVRLATGLG
jgi:hypothetical protein